MKKLLSLTLALLLLGVCATALGEDIIINKITDTANSFEFPEDAKLLEVYFPAIYGVDAAYVRYGDYGMLIDCAGIGPLKQWETFDKMLTKLGVTEVNYAVNSHPDADHIGGFNHVLDHISCGEFILGFPEDYDEGDEVRFTVYRDLHNLGIPFRRVANGDTLDFGDAQVTVYQRFDEEIARVNGKSVMLMIQLGERRIFFTGDIMYYNTQKLLAEDAENLDLHADILKYPHHGYEALNQGFYEMVHPKLAIITSGSQDAKKAAEFLRNNGVKFHYTEQGTIRLATDGTVWTVERIK